MRATGTILVRGDSAFRDSTVVAACRRAGANFSLSLQTNPKLAAAIADIDEAAWTLVRYPGSVLGDTTGQWISESRFSPI